MNNKRVATVFVVVMVVICGLFIFTNQPTIEDNVLFNWRVLVYPASGLDVDEDIQAVVTVYDDVTDFVTAQDSVESLILERVMYQERYVMMANGTCLMNSTTMNQWRWRVMAHNGTINNMAPENNTVYQNIYMHQNMNRNMWNGVVGEGEWQYSFSYTYNGYIVEIQLDEY